jgi:hypothetical protein
MNSEMKNKIFIIFLLILLSSLSLLLLPEIASAFSVFGVGSQAMTTESIENYENWPYEVRRQCVIEQSRVVTDCSKCGYENWVVYQTVEGKGKVDGKDCTMLYEGVVVGNYTCEFTELVIEDGKLVGTELFINYEEFRQEVNGAMFHCRFSCHAWNCAEEEPSKKNKLEGLDRKHIRCQTYLYHDRDLDFKDDNTGETRHQMHDRFVREFGKELCEAEPGEDCTFEVVYERFVYLEKFAVSQDDEGPYEAVYYEPEVLFGEFCIYCSCRDFGWPKTTLREGDLEEAKRLLEKYEKYDLLRNIDQARVTPQFKSTGAVSGHVANLTVTSNTDELLTFGLKNTGLEGMLLVNPIEEEGNLVVATIPGISVGPTSYEAADSVTLNPNESITFPVTGYCANFDKKNPSGGIELTLGVPIGVEPAEECILDSLLGDSAQTAVVVNLETTEFPQSFTPEDVITTKQIALWASQSENADKTPADYETRGYPIKEDYIPIIRDVLAQSGVNPDEIVALTGEKREPEEPTEVPSEPEKPAEPPKEGFPWIYAVAAVVAVILAIVGVSVYKKVKK